MAPIMQTDLQDYLPLVASGKVREVYELDRSTLLFVATDRISGKVLNGPPWTGLILMCFCLRRGNEECTPTVKLAFALRPGKDD